RVHIHMPSSPHEKLPGQGSAALGRYMQLSGARLASFVRMRSCRMSWSVGGGTQMAPRTATLPRHSTQELALQSPNAPSTGQWSPLGGLPGSEHFSLRGSGKSSCCSIQLNCGPDSVPSPESMTSSWTPPTIALRFDG